MSYILEGLKKLEQKRKQQEMAPQSVSFDTQDQMQGTANSSRRSVWFGIIAAALLLNAGIMYFFFQRTVDTKISTAPESKKAAPNNVSPNTHAVTPGTPTSGRPLSPAALQPTSKTAVPKNGPAPVQREKAAPVPDVKPKQTAVATTERIERRPTPVTRTVRLSELPEEITKTLPEFKVSAHFYSPDAKVRFARINDKILHEGDSLNEGLKVEEINSNGTVFNYQGHRFLVGINQNQ